MRKPSTVDSSTPACQVVVIWIDWYAYHLARFAGLQSAFGKNGEVVGIEWVGGAGVHTGFTFRQERPSGLPVETIMPDESWSSAGKVALAAKTWRRLSKLRPRTVLVPGYYTLPAIAAAVWARTHGAASVLMTESTAFDHPRTGWKEALKSKMLQVLFGWAVVGGLSHREYLAQLSFPMERVKGAYDVVGNDALRMGTCHLRDTSSGRDHGLPDNYFLFVGRLAPEKNVGGLLQAWLSYRKAGGKWSLVLAGDGPEFHSLRAALEHSSFAGEVIFAGHTSSQKLLPFYAFASCFVLPSTREPWGLVVNEAMAAGLPVIVSTRCGCARDLVGTDDNGMTFDPENTVALTRCLQNIEALEPQGRKRMGAASLRKIAEFSPEKFGSEVAAIANQAEVPTSASKPVLERVA